MIKKLKITKRELYWIDEKNVRHEGVHAGISGDVSGITGNVSGISGDVSGISGNVSGIRGDIDECGITSADRKQGINIADLIEG